MTRFGVPVGLAIGGVGATLLTSSATVGATGFAAAVASVPLLRVLDQDDDATESTSIHVDCAVETCDATLAPSDAYPADRDGVVCWDCWKYEAETGHWPDEDPEPPAPEPSGLLAHDCNEADADVFVITDGSCPRCGSVAPKRADVEWGVPA